MSASGDLDSNKDEEDIFDKGSQLTITENTSESSNSKTSDGLQTFDNSKVSPIMSEGVTVSSLDINTSGNQIENVSLETDDVLLKTMSNDASEKAIDNVDVVDQQIDTPASLSHSINEGNELNAASQDNKLRSDKVPITSNQTTTLNDALEETLLDVSANSVIETADIESSDLTLLKNESDIPKDRISEHSSEKQEVDVTDKKDSEINAYTDVIDSATISGLEDSHIPIEFKSSDCSLSKVIAPETGEADKERVQTETVIADIDKVITSTPSIVHEDSTLVSNNVSLTSYNHDTTGNSATEIELPRGSDDNAYDIENDMTSKAELISENNEKSVTNESEKFGTLSSENNASLNTMVAETTEPSDNNIVTAIDSQDTIVTSKEIIAGECELRCDNGSTSDNQFDSANTSTEERLLYESDDNVIEAVNNVSSASLPINESEVPDDSIVDNISEKQLTENNLPTTLSEVQEVSESISETETSSKDIIKPVTDVIMDEIEEEELIKDKKIIDTNVEMDKIGKSIKAVLETGKCSTVSGMSTKNDIVDVPEVCKAHEKSTISLETNEGTIIMPESTDLQFEAVNENVSIATISSENTNQGDEDQAKAVHSDTENSFNISSTDNSPIHFKTSHRLHRPDVMLEIPTQELIDIDDVLDSPNDCSYADDFLNNSKIDDNSDQNKSNELIAEAIDKTSNENLSNITSNLEENLPQEVDAVTVKGPLIEDPQPSTSGSYKLCVDTSDDLPEVSDSLGLLAESERVRDDDDEDDAADEDDDFDHDESSNQMLTAEQSEDSNAPHSEAEPMREQTETREDADDKISNESDGDIDDITEEQANKNEFDAVEIEEYELGDNTDVVAEEESVLCEEEVKKAEEVHEKLDDTPCLPDESTEAIPEAMNSEDSDTSKTIDKNNDDTVMSKENVIKEKDETVVSKEKDKQENDNAVFIADETPSAEKSSIDDDVIEQPNIIPTYNVLDSDSEDDALPGSEQKKKDKKTDVAEVSSQKAHEVVIEDKTKKFGESIEMVKAAPLLNESVVSIVDLQESSDEDGVTTINIPKGIEVRSTSIAVGSTPEIHKTPGKTVISGVLKVTSLKPLPRLNTSEVTIKTSSGPEQTLLIPEAQAQTEGGTLAKTEPVYNIDSDEEETKESTKPDKKTKKCINNSCSSGVKVYKVADAETAAYYDASRKRRPLVCQPCADAVLAWKQRLITGIKDMIPLTQLDMSSKCQYSVEILDSESEDEEPAPMEEQVKEAIGEDAASFLERHLADVFNETWTKYSMDERLKDTQDELNAEIESLDVKRKEIDDMLSECQRMTDKLRTDLYATFEPRIQEEPSLLIIDKPDFRYIGPELGCPDPSDVIKNPATAKRKLSTNNNTPAKRPAVIPLGYAPLNDPRLKESKVTANNSDDDKDVSVVKLSAESPPPDLPPPGELTRTPLRLDMQVYAMKNAFGPWLKGKITEIMPKGTTSANFTACRVQFNHVSKNNNKILPGRCIAYADPPEVRMTIGTRLVALFKGTRYPCYSSGVVAEAPTPVNNYRYLVFFDDGYAQYVKHSHTRLVCECSPLVWDEVHPFSREFVKEYLMAYPERPMVRLHKGQHFKTEWNGKWLASRVAKVDASLVEVEFLGDGRREWIYRGSTRLAPLYMELKAAERHRPRLLLGSRGRQQPRTDMPYVEYTRSEEQNTNKLVENLPDNTGMSLQQQNEEIRRQRAVAKKSTTMPSLQQGQTGARVHTDHPDSVTSRVVYYTPKSAVKPYKLVPHHCSPKCKRTDVLSLKELRTYNPLAKPLLSGWERQILRFKGQKEVMYRAPCGRRLRNMKELHRYLRATDSELPVDLFDFYYGTHCLAEFQIYKCLTGKKDLSHGKENVPVPCVNYYDESLPEFCSYNTERTPTSGVPLNLDPEFLCGCDCTDDCEDKSKCACWKMTLEGAHTIGLEGPNIGYEYKRLPEPLASGIYECNSRCKCKQTCLNRVAQHPLQLKLQVFKTLRRGWGIRALNDVPKGAFLCVYAGNLLTDATANLDGLNEGDEYLAELDYIEVVEQMKEGYEDDIPEADKKLDKKSSDKTKVEDSQDESAASSEEDESHSKYDEQDDDFRPGHIGSEVTQFRKNLRKRSRDEEKGAEAKDKEKDNKDKNPDEDCITISDDEEVREPSSFAAQSGMSSNEFVPKYKSVRAYFGEDEACYIMDAKVQGNIGRYLNHSCSPNVFVQNVFVDTHDPRFPWVAFFALSHIKAGTELTWNYNYDVGSVPGKVLYCYCQSRNCRGRLL